MIRIELLNHDLRAAQKRVQELEDELAENRPDLAIWWEAYRSILGSLAVDNVLDYTIKSAGEHADLALAAYKAKAAELRSK